MTVVKKMEIINEEMVITTEQGMQYVGKDIPGTKKYRLVTVKTQTVLGTFELFKDVIDAITTYEKIIDDYVHYMNKEEK